MGNTIGINSKSPHEKRLSMSNQGTDVFLELLISASEEISHTAPQEKLIEFLREQKDINDIAPGTAGFDIAEMPWINGSKPEDIGFLIKVTELAKEPKILEKAGFDPENEIIRSWLEAFEDMLKEFSELND